MLTEKHTQCRGTWQWHCDVYLGDFLTMINLIWSTLSNIGDGTNLSRSEWPWIDWLAPWSRWQVVTVTLASSSPSWFVANSKTFVLIKTVFTLCAPVHAIVFLCNTCVSLSNMLHDGVKERWHWCMRWMQKVRPRMKSITLRLSSGWMNW